MERVFSFIVSSPLKLILVFSFFLSSDGVPGSHHFPLTFENTTARGSHEPQGHCFNTSKQSNYQCYYLDSIVMELMLWQIVESASFQMYVYCESCVSSDCLQSARCTPSVLLVYVSIVTPLFLLQSISQSNSHALASYPNP